MVPPLALRATRLIPYRRRHAERNLRLHALDAPALWLVGLEIAQVELPIDLHVLEVPGDLVFVGLQVPDLGGQVVAAEQAEPRFDEVALVLLRFGSDENVVVELVRR